MAKLNSNLSSSAKSIGNRLNRQTASLFLYASLALPLAFAGLPIYLIAPDYYAINHNISLTTLGLCLLFLRFTDAFIDPILGRILDRYSSLFSALMSISAIVLGLGILMIFWVPDFQPKQTLAWFCIAIFITTFAYSFLSIGYGMQGALWSEQHSEQVRLTSLRELFSIVGLILSVTLPFYLFEKMPADSAVKTVSAFMAITLAICYLIYRRFPIKTPKESVQKNLSTDWSQLKNLYLIYGISAIASAIPAVLVIFFVRDYLGLGNASGLFLLVYFFAGACSIPLWRRIAVRKGKLIAWQYSMALAIGSFVFVLFVSPGDIWLYVLICIGSGFALGADLSLPPALLSELISKQKGNQNTVGTQYAGLTCLNKLSLALAAGLSLPILELIGFAPAMENSPVAMSKLLWLYGGVPCSLKLIAMLFAQKWKIKV